MTNYYLIRDKILGKNEDGKYYLFSDGKWEPDTSWYILGKLGGYDPDEPPGSPYGWGSSSIMDEIVAISEEEAQAFIAKTKDQK